MSGRIYKRHDIETFGAFLLESGDLDPIYIMLVSAHNSGQLPKHTMYRWLVAYWCFYSAGLASWLSEKSGKDFWDWCELILRESVEPPTGGRWPRGHERRHFRAAAGLKSIKALRESHPDPERLVNILCSFKTFPEVSNAAQVYPGFGPWIGFKVADMIDRVAGVPVAFDRAGVLMFKEPEKSAILLYDERHPGADVPKARKLEWAAEYLIQHFSDYYAPPFGDRPVNIQEVETILCKWKSHRNGHYPLGNDLREIHAGLAKWAPHSEVARILQPHLPELPELGREDQPQSKSVLQMDLFS